MVSKSLVRSVSRSFSLSLLSLPREKRDFVSLVYLIARTADSFADSGNWSADQRLAYLDGWEKALFRGKDTHWSIKDSLGSFSASEAELLLQGDSLLKAYHRASASDRQTAEELFQVLFQGMRWAIKKFSTASEASPVYGNQTEKDFDFYCYAHAGCVGSFWTKIFSLPPHLDAFSVEYGKALERVNVMRDLIRDRKDGRILLPADVLTRYGLLTSEPWNEAAWPDFCRDYIQQTRRMLLRGAFYCDSIPKSHRRLRWASMMPLKIGMRSLDLYERELLGESPLKISRKEVYHLAIQSLWDVCAGLKVSNRSDFKEIA